MTLDLQYRHSDESMTLDLQYRHSDESMTLDLQYRHSDESRNPCRNKRLALRFFKL